MKYLKIFEKMHMGVVYRLLNKIAAAGAARSAGHQGST